MAFGLVEKMRRYNKACVDGVLGRWMEEVEEVNKQGKHEMIITDGT